MGKRKTTEEFKAELKKIQPSIEVIGEYVNNNTKILIKDTSGEYLSRPLDLLKGHPPTIQTATNKNLYFINQAIKVHGDKYDYSKSKYKDARTKIIITCKTHGDFKQTPKHHLDGRGCKKCGYNDVNGRLSVTTAERNKSEWCNTPAIVYHIRCWNDSEEFDKIGITMHTVKERFPGKFAMPYEYKVIREVKTDLYEAVYLEEQLHEYYKDKGYIPKIKFGGYTECFSKIN